MRCDNCHRLTIQDLDVPDVEDAPRDADALLESAFLGRQRFKCGKCDEVIALIVAIKELELDEQQDELPRPHGLAMLHG